MCPLLTEQSKEPYMNIRCLAEAASIISVGRPHRVVRNAHFLSVLQHIPDKTSLSLV